VTICMKSATNCKSVARLQRSLSSAARKTSPSKVDDAIWGFWEDIFSCPLLASSAILLSVASSEMSCFEIFVGNGRDF